MLLRGKTGSSSQVVRFNLDSIMATAKFCRRFPNCLKWLSSAKKNSPKLIYLLERPQFFLLYYAHYGKSSY
jgi:hypothetical protein